MQKTYNFVEKIRERVWMLWWQIKSDIREGIVQQWKRFAMLGIIYAVCVIYFIMICSFSRHIDSYTCGDMILWVLRGVKKYDSGVIKTVDISSVYMLPNIFVVYIVGNYVIKDLYGFGKNIIVRTGSRFNWWISKCIWGILTAVLSYAILYAVIIVAGICTGGVKLAPTPEVCYSAISMDKQIIIQNTNLTGLVISLMAMSLLMTITFCIIQITVGLIISPVIGYVIVMSYLIIGAFSDNPFIISIYCMALRNGIYSPEGYNILLGVIIMAAITIFCMVAGSLYIRKMDIINQKQEWQGHE